MTRDIHLQYEELPLKNAPLLNTCFRFKAVLLLLLVFLAYHLSVRQVPVEKQDYKEFHDLPRCTSHHSPSKERLSRLIEDFHSCAFQVFQRWKNDTLTMTEKWLETEICDVFFSRVEKFILMNKYGRRIVISPKCNDDYITMITLGVADGIEAEKELKKFLPNTRFFGVDKEADKNQEIYSEIGNFYPATIGNNSEVSSMKREEVLKKLDSIIIPFDYLLANVLQLKKVDIVWITVGGVEFDFLSQFHRGAELDQRGITICQIHMEFHTKSREKEFEDFIYRIISEKRFVFMKPFHRRLQVHQILLVNVEDEGCVRKYF